MHTNVVEQEANARLSWAYGGWVVLAVASTWLAHEFAHWLAASSLGYEAAMTLNSVYLVEGAYELQGHRILVSAVGPLVTIAQAFGVFLLLQHGRWRTYLYPFLFTPLYMRVLAGGMNVINLNDEGRISEALGLGAFTLPLVVSVGLGYLVYRVARTHRLSWSFQVGTVLIVMLVSSVLILADQLLSIRIF